MFKIILIMSITTCFNFVTFGQSSVSLCNEQLEAMPIQQKGRVKPLRVHAKETVKYLTGKSKHNGLSSVITYCKLSTNSLHGLQAKIEHVEIMKILKLGKSHFIKYEELITRGQQLNLKYNSISENSSLKKSLSNLLQKMMLYRTVKSGEDWFVPTTIDNKTKWETISSLPITPSFLDKAKSDFIKINSDQYLVELTYSKLHLTHWSLLFVLLALFFAVLSKKLPIALTLATLAISGQTAALIFRILISERAPITNMYESVMFSGFGGLILAMIIGHLRKDKLILIVGLSYNVCTLFMITFANGMLPSDIGPLVPVLRDNFWLSTHVTTIILSYGALALSWVMANIVLVKGKFFKLDSSEERYYSDLIYLCLKYGTVLLAAGIILGGIWADYSWGRFWGWDPKETWSLIVLCIYMAIIHGKYSSWIPASRFIPLTAGAFMSVMMAWFGVNYILASGLHSYGFSQGGTLFLITFFILQILLLVITIKPKKQENSNV